MLQISASIMCADQLNIGRDVAELEACQVEYLHLDVMDGHFVNNIALGIDCCARLSNQKTPRDIHLLVEEPEKFIDSLKINKGDIVGVHFESKVDLAAISSKMHGAGAKLAVVLNPETDIEKIRDYLADIDIVSLMMIKPGFPGLEMEKGMLEKIEDVRQWLDNNTDRYIPIEVDGHVNADCLPTMYANGARIFVAGTSSVFRKDVTITEGIDRLRKCVSFQ